MSWCVLCILLYPSPYPLVYLFYYQGNIKDSHNIALLGSESQRRGIEVAPGPIIHAALLGPPISHHPQQNTSPMAKTTTWLHTTEAMDCSSAGEEERKRRGCMSPILQSPHSSQKSCRAEDVMPTSLQYHSASVHM